MPSAARSLRAPRAPAPRYWAGGPGAPPPLASAWGAGDRSFREGPPASVTGLCALATPSSPLRSPAGEAPGILETR